MRRRRRSYWSGYHGHFFQPSYAEQVKNDCRMLIREFIKSEFYSMNPSNFEELSDFYGRKYGDNAKGYLRRTYSKWRTGQVNPSGQTIERILHCVPRFLPPEKQFSILKFYVPAFFVDLTHNSNTSKCITESDIGNKFKEMLELIQNQKYQLDWFVNDVFSDLEINEFVSVVKHAMIDRLRISYYGVLADIAELRSAIAKIPIEGAKKVSYRITLLNSTISFDSLNVPTTWEFPVAPPPNLLSSLKIDYQRFLRDKFIDHLLLEKSGVAKQLIALDNIETHLFQVANIQEDLEVNANIELEAHSGVIYLSFHRKNLLNLRLQQVKSFVYHFIGLAFLGGLTYALAQQKSSDGFAIWPFFFFLVVLIKAKLEYSEQAREIEEYERERAKRLA